jgi:3-hydroxybutyrate dehydrogenase
VASKHGITGLTKAIALEGAEFNITCNAICPGYVRTPLVEGQIKDQAKLHGISEEEVINKIMLEQHAVKEFVSIESLAGMALFLSSEEAKVITGASIPMEGGWTAK